jgi:hypothetical protein
MSHELFHPTNPEPGTLNREVKKISEIVKNDDKSGICKVYRQKRRFDKFK